LYEEWLSKYKNPEDAEMQDQHDENDDPLKKTVLSNKSLTSNNMKPEPLRAQK
jgi:hypothetical protein